MRNNMVAFVMATLTLLAGSTTPGIAQVSDAGADTATPAAVAQVDPLEQPTPRCIIDADTHYVYLDKSQVKSNRKLRRRIGPNPQPESDTRFVALKTGSNHWITHCPVILQALHVVDHGQVCTPVSVIAPNNGYSVLRIARDGSGLVFKIQASALGALRGKLTPVTNPHGPDEEVWLQSSDVTVDGKPNGDYEFYVYLQEGRNGYKFYLVEVFVRADVRCRDEHLPGPNTLCRNPDDGSVCARQQVARDGFSKGMDAGLRLMEADTGGGHEPVERP